jgi:integrase
MNYVEPIRDLKTIELIKNELSKNHSGNRDKMLFIFGINVGLRISDIIKLKVKDISSGVLNINENKTSKLKYLPLAHLKNEIDVYIEGKLDDDYLFPSRNGINKPISRFQAWNILHFACKKLNIDNIGTHTLRKTFGYHYYKNTKDIVALQKLLNHSTPDGTLRYIGINQDVIDNSLKGFKLG